VTTPQDPYGQPPPPPGYERAPGYNDWLRDQSGQQPGTPLQQPLYPGPQPQPGYGPPPPPGRRRRPRKHTARNVVLGVIGAGALIVVITAVASGGRGTGSPAAGTGTASPAASTGAPSAVAAAPAATGTAACAARVLAWQHGPGGHLLTAVDADAQTISTDADAGKAAEAAAASAKLAAQARQAAAHPIPPCADPAADYPEAMALWSQGGQDGARDDFSDAAPLINQGTGYLAKATAEVRKLSGTA
jgi:hypothetical protein